MEICSNKGEEEQEKRKGANSAHFTPVADSKAVSNLP